MLVVYKADVAVMTGRQEGMVLAVLQSGGLGGDMCELMRASDYGALCLDAGCFHGVALVKVRERANQRSEHEIMAVCTAPAWRGRGVATELLGLITGESDGHDTRVCLEHSTPAHERVIEFFARRGFAVESRGATRTDMKYQM